MTNRSILLLTILGLAFPGRAFCADAKADLRELVGKVQAKLKAGKATEADLADELNGFDAAVAAHKSEKTDDVAHLLFMKGMLYVQVLHDNAKGAATLQQLKSDFPDSLDAKKIDPTLAMIAHQEGAMKLQNSLVAGVPFPPFDEKDVNGKTFSVSAEQGKVTLIDFWATWCGPCVAELPNVLSVYAKHHGEGFDILGVSLDNDKTKLTTFVQDKKITWPQYFDGLEWDNKLATKYGVVSIPATFLLDRNGKIIGKNMRGPALEEAVVAALAAR